MVRTKSTWNAAPIYLLPHHLAAFERPWAEPGSLPDALYQLETALTFAAPFEEQEWLAQVLDELREFRGTLELYAGGEDYPDSFLADIDLTGPGQVRQGLKLCREQADLLAQARFLLLLIEKEAEYETIHFGHIRRRLGELVKALRRYRTMETELLLDSLCTDIGTGD